MKVYDKPIFFYPWISQTKHEQKVIDDDIFKFLYAGDREGGGWVSYFLLNKAWPPQNYATWLHFVFSLNSTVTAHAYTHQEAI